MNDQPSLPPREFLTTQWSVVLAANPGDGSATQARVALETLCRSYWYPLYAFVRFRGYSASDAEDLTQSFFAQVVVTGGLAAANPERGRFRSYVLGALKNFLANEWHRGQAQKRGGGKPLIELDSLTPEARYALEPGHTEDADAGFDRVWAQESIARAREKLRVEWESKGKGDQFAALEGSLTGAEIPRQEAAARLHLTEGALKVAIHRLRQRFREILRAEVGETLADASEIEDEMRYLIRALRESS